MGKLQEHPLFLVGIAITGTIGLSILILTEIILPTHSFSLKNEIIGLNSKISTLEEANRDLTANKIKLEKELRELGSTKQNLEDKIKTLNSTINNYLTTHLLSFESPYPKDFDYPRLGDDIDSLYKKYDPKLITENEGDDETYFTYQMKLTHEVLEEVTYYSKNKKGKIHKIIFTIKLYTDRFELRFSRQYLFDQLTKSLGTPIAWDGNEHFSWNIGNKVSVYHQQNTDYFSILPLNEKPFIWPKKIID